MARVFTPKLKAWHFLALFVLLTIATHIWVSWRWLSPFNGHYADGPFQLFNALRRIDAGQLPGRDFPAFHGLGLPLVHYPFYRALGGELLGSEASRQLLTRFVAIGSYFLTSWLLTRSLWPGVFWLLLRLVGDKVFGPVFGLYELHDLDGPGNSLLTLRATIPLLFIGFVYRSPPGWRGALWLGLTMCIAWMLGLDQFLALVAGVLVTGIGFKAVHWLRPRPLESPPLLSGLGIGLLLTVALTALLVGDQLLAVFKYSLVLIPKEQVWYFGVYPNRFIGDGTLGSTIMGIYFVLFVLGFAAAWLWSLWQASVETDSDRLRLLVATAVGVSYGCVSLSPILGYVYFGYLFVPARVAVVLATVWAIRAARNSPSWERWRSAIHNSRAIPVGAFALLGLWAVFLVWQSRSLKWPAVSDRWKSTASEMASAIQADIPQPKAGDLWSTYAGIVEDRLGIYHPDTDYIIHALADKRDAYIRRFGEVQPRFAQTIKRDMSPYEEWLQTTTWGFYERLLLNYDIVAETDHSFLWRRTDRRWVEPADAVVWKQTLALGQETVSVPAGPANAEIAVVRVDYQVKNPLNWLPVLGGLGRFLVNPGGTNSQFAVSLPPAKSSWTFPVFVKPGKPYVLSFQTLGPQFWSSLQVTDVSVRYLSLRPANAAFLKLPSEADR